MSPYHAAKSNAFMSAGRADKRQYRILCRQIELFDWRAAVKVG